MRLRDETKTRARLYQRKITKKMTGIFCFRFKFAPKLNSLQVHDKATENPIPIWMSAALPKSFITVFSSDDPEFILVC